MKIDIAAILNYTRQGHPEAIWDGTHEDIDALCSDVAVRETGEDVTNGGEFAPEQPLLEQGILEYHSYDGDCNTFVMHIYFTDLDQENILRVSDIKYIRTE